MKLRLREILNARHMSNRELARQTGIMPCTINDIVNGKRNPNGDTLDIIAEKLNCRVSDLIDEPKPQEQQYIVCPKCGEKIYFGTEITDLPKKE